MRGGSCVKRLRSYWSLNSKRAFPETTGIQRHPASFCDYGVYTCKYNTACGQGVNAPMYTVIQRLRRTKATCCPTCPCLHASSRTSQSCNNMLQTCSHMRNHASALQAVQPQPALHCHWYLQVHCLPLPLCLLTHTRIITYAVGMEN
jgi:hypothetical protein